MRFMSRLTKLSKIVMSSRLENMVGAQGWEVVRYRFAFHLNEFPNIHELEMGLV